MNKNDYILLVAVFFLVGLAFLAGRNVSAESSPTPDSGVLSKISELYQDLVSLGYGSEVEGAWGDWGVVWNRIRSAAEWTPLGNATEADVVLGKTFYSDDRSEKTGTLVVPEAFDYSLQQFNQYDDYEGPVTSDPEDYDLDESTWTNTSLNVWKDERTGLYWSNNQGWFSNLFPNQDHSGCAFFSSNPRSGYDGTDSDCGNAINTCATLVTDSNNDGVPDTDWYLPTYKELMQAHLDGIYNQAGSAFTIEEHFWSSTENAMGQSYAWTVQLSTGDSEYTNTKGTEDAVRCVRRD